MMRPLWFACSVAAGLALAGAARADLYCERPAFQAGDVKSGVALTHWFVFTNRGAEAVEVVELKPSCGCLTPSMQQRHFAPGESGALTMQINTLGAEIGPTLWRVVVRYRRGDRTEEMPLTVSARVTAEITMNPASLALFTDGPIKRDVTLVDVRPQAMKVTKVESISPQVRAACDEPHHDADGRWTYALHVEVAADYPEGRRDEALIVYTTDPDYPELRVPFTVVKRAKQRVTAAPAAVEWTGPTGRPSPSKLVLLHAAEGEEVEIVGVECDSAAVHCDWSPGPRTTAAVKVRLDSPPAAGLKSTIRVHMSKPIVQTVEVPLMCTPSN